MTSLLFPCPPCESDRTVDILDVDVSNAVQAFVRCPWVRVACPDCHTPVTIMVSAIRWWEIVNAKADVLETLHAWSVELDAVKYPADLGAGA